MSGVSRLRQAHKDHKLPVKTTGEAREGSAGSVTVSGKADRGLSPKPGRPQFDTAPFTGAPQGRALPVRGEGPTQNSITVPKS